MASPVSINSEVLYDVKNYGTGMTPFYTNLALWVGGLILVSILKQEVDKDAEVSDFPIPVHISADGCCLLYLQ